MNRTPETIFFHTLPVYNAGSETMPAKLKCESVWREVSNYVEHDVAASRRKDLEQHLKTCSHCRAVFQGTRNLVKLAGDRRAWELPAGFSERLQSRLEQQVAALSEPAARTPQDMAIGITDERVALGSHLIYFWENDRDFARGVRFLHPGLGRGEHCIAFGHAEALDKVQETLRAQGYDPERLQRDHALTLLRRQAAAETTLFDITAVIEAALRAGARAVRFLGNLGMGRDPLPAGEDDVLVLENRVTSLIEKFPCVVVCMYDVRTLSGRMILRGGFQAHRLAICAHGIEENPYFVAETDSISLRRIH